MPSIPPTVTRTYAYGVGIDTHAATHTYAVIEAATGAAIDTATFPTSAAGITRATTWIARRTHGLISDTLISMEGTGSYGSRLAARLADHGYRVVEAPAARRLRGHGKTDTIDALLAARGTNAMTLAELRDRRNGEQREALQILTTAREQLNHDLLAAINALTALLRRHDLGIDARKALSRRQVTAISAWRSRHEGLADQVARAEAVRLAKRVVEMRQALRENTTLLQEIVQDQAPQLLELPGVGPVTAATVLMVWSHPGRIRSEAAFASIAGTNPIPASSGNTVRHRLNRGGDRRLNHAVNTIAVVRMRMHPDTRAYVERRTAQGRTKAEIRRCLKRYVIRQLYRTLAAQSDAQTTTPALEAA